MFFNEEEEEEGALKRLEMNALKESLRLLMVEESQQRSTILVAEHTDRGVVACGRVSLFDADTFTCPAPQTDAFYSSFLARRRLELTEKYQHLVTRQMLREERWLEYTVGMLKELVDAETVAREQLIIASLQDIPRLTLCHMQLQMISAQGTEGTVIYVEEVEREVRFRVIIFDEIQAYEELQDMESRERANAQQRTRERLDSEADARGCIEAAEWNARWQVERDEEKAWDPLIALEPGSRHQICELLLWRVMVAEADERYAMEQQWERALFSVNTSRCSDDEGDVDVTEDDDVINANGELRELVAQHSVLCAGIHEEQRRIVADREEARALMAEAFAYAHPIAQPPHDDDGDEEENDDVVVIYGHRVTSCLPMRPAGQLPQFVQPPPVAEAEEDEEGTPGPCVESNDNNNVEREDENSYSPQHQLTREEINQKREDIDHLWQVLASDDHTGGDAVERYCNFSEVAGSL